MESEFKHHVADDIFATLNQSDKPQRNLAYDQENKSIWLPDTCSPVFY